MTLCVDCKEAPSLYKSEPAERNQDTRDFLNCFRAVGNALKRRKDLAAYLPFCAEKIAELETQLEEVAR